MYYIDPAANESGNHGNPQGQPFPGCVAMPEKFLRPYLDAMGFVHITVDHEEVTAVETNQAALDAYKETHPDKPPEPPAPEEDPVSWAVLAKAIQEGVDQV